MQPPGRLLFNLPALGYVAALRTIEHVIVSLLQCVSFLFSKWANGDPGAGKKDGVLVMH